MCAYRIISSSLEILARLAASKTFWGRLFLFPEYDIFAMCSFIPFNLLFSVLNMLSGKTTDLIISPIGGLILTGHEYFSSLIVKSMLKFADWVESLKLTPSVEDSVAFASSVIIRVKSWINIPFCKF